MEWFLCSVENAEVEKAEGSDERAGELEGGWTLISFMPPLSSETTPYFILVLFVILAGVVFPIVKNAYAAASLLAANVVVFVVVRVFSMSHSPVEYYSLVASLAFNPPVFFSGENVFSLLTSMFFHIEPWHIFFNLFFLIFWATNLENRIGARAVVLLYLFTGAVATLGYGLLHFHGSVLLLGASGALMGIAGCFAALYPDERMTFIFFFVVLPKVRVSIALVFLLLVETFLALAYPHSGIAHEAHFFGVAAGLVVGMWLNKKFAVGEKKRFERADDRKNRLVHVLRAVEREMGDQPDAVEALKKAVESHDEEKIMFLWLEEFLKKARCPGCSLSLSQSNSPENVLGGTVQCKSCGWTLEVDDFG